MGGGERHICGMEELQGREKTSLTTQLLLPVISHCSFGEMFEGRFGGGIVKTSYWMGKVILKEDVLEWKEPRL